MCAIRAGAQGSRIGRTADVAGDSVRTTVFWRAMPGHRRSMTLRATALLQVTDMLYTAALIDDVKGAATAAWAGALGLLGQTCGATGSVVMGISCSRHEFLRAVFVGLDPCTAGRYTSYYAARDPVLEPALARSAPGTLLFSESLIERPVFIRSEFYCDWMQSIGMFAGAAVTLVQSETSRAVLYMSRERTAGSFTTDDEAALASLIPHLQRATQLAIRLAAHQSDRRPPAHLHASSVPVIIADQRARPIYANAAAELLLRNAGSLKIEPQPQGVSGSLCGLTAAATRHLRALIASVCGTGARHTADSMSSGIVPASSGGSIVLRDVRGAAALLVMVSPMPIVAQGPGCLFHDCVPASSEARAVLSIVDLSVPYTNAVSHAGVRRCLSEHFGLTDAEAAVAVDIAGGAGLAAIAEIRCVTLATVRNQAARIYLKTNTRGQVALAAFVTRLSERIGTLSS